LRIERIILIAWFFGFVLICYCSAFICYRLLLAVFRLAGGALQSSQANLEEFKEFFLQVFSTAKKKSFANSL